MRPLTSPNSNFTRPAYPTISTDGRRISPEQAQRELFSAIEFASDVDFPSLCEKAISNGAQVNSTDAQGKTSIQSAIESGSVIKLRYLSARYAQLPEVNHNGTNILMLAATEDHADIVQFLIDEANMDFNAVDTKGVSALHFAVINEGIATMKILLECQANPNQLTNSLEENDLKRIFGENFNEFDCLKNGKHISPLMIATALNNHEAVSLLIDHHANVQLGAIPPLLIAIKNNNERMIAILSQAQARTPSYQHPIRINISLITYAINNNINAPCLQCLLNENSKYIQINQEQIFDLFKIFIQNNRPDYLALFLAAGIDVNDDNAYKYLMILSQNSSNKNIFFNLLAYRNANEFEKKIESKKPIVKIFEDLEKERSILTLLEKGMFQTVANIIYQVYLETKTGNPISNIEQVNFAICLKLVPENLLHKEIFPDFFYLKMENIWLQSG
jgi:ankyrin repeat protein